MFLSALVRRRLPVRLGDRPTCSLTWHQRHRIVSVPRTSVSSLASHHTKPQSIWLIYHSITLTFSTKHLQRHSISLSILLLLCFVSTFRSWIQKLLCLIIPSVRKMLYTYAKAFRVGCRRGCGSCARWPRQQSGCDGRLASFIRQTRQQHLSCVLFPHPWIAIRPFCYVSRYREKRRMRYSQFSTRQSQRTTRRHVRIEPGHTSACPEHSRPRRQRIKGNTLHRTSRSCTDIGRRSFPCVLCSCFNLK